MNKNIKYFQINTVLSFIYIDIFFKNGILFLMIWLIIFEIELHWFYLYFYNLNTKVFVKNFQCFLYFIKFELFLNEKCVYQYYSDRILFNENKIKYAIVKN